MMPTKTVIISDIQDRGFALAGTPKGLALLNDADDLMDDLRGVPRKSRASRRRRLYARLGCEMRRARLARKTSEV